MGGGERAGRLLAEIDLSRRGAHVRIVPLPIEAGVNGPDDFVGRHGDHAFIALLEAAADARTFDAIFRLNMRHAVVVYLRYIKPVRHQIPEPQLGASTISVPGALEVDFAGKDYGVNAK